MKQGFSERTQFMRFSIIAICVLAPMAAMGQTGSTSGNSNSQGFFSRLKSRTTAQTSAEPQQIAQPASPQYPNRQGITFPQQAARQYQQAPAQARPGSPPPSQMAPYPNQYDPRYGQPVRPQVTPASTHRAESDDDSSTRKKSSSEKDNTNSGSSSSSRKSTHDSDEKESSKSNSSKSDSSSKKEESGNSKGSSDNNDSEKTSKKSEGSSALEKIVKKVDAADKEESEKSKAKQTEAEKEQNRLNKEMNQAADDATTAVARFLKSANDGVYSKALNYLTPETEKYFSSEISAVNGPLKTVLDGLTHNGNITMVTYANTTVRGEGAVVDAELGFDNGGTERHSFDLLKTKDGWKIVLPVNGKVSARPTEGASSHAMAAGQAGTASFTQNRNPQMPHTAPVQTPVIQAPVATAASPGLAPMETPAAPAPTSVTGATSGTVTPTPAGK
jgi:hypothetical protein